MASGVVFLPAGECLTIIFRGFKPIEKSGLHVSFSLPSGKNVQYCIKVSELRRV
jgi:hypothetical protein